MSPQRPERGETGVTPCARSVLVALAASRAMSSRFRRRGERPTSSAVASCVAEGSSVRARAVVPPQQTSPGCSKNGWLRSQPPAKIPRLARKPSLTAGQTTRTQTPSAVSAKTNSASDAEPNVGPPCGRIDAAQTTGTVAAIAGRRAARPRRRRHPAAGHDAQAPPRVRRSGRGPPAPSSRETPSEDRHERPRAVAGRESRRRGVSSTAPPNGA